MLENQQVADAKGHLQALVASGKEQDEAHYYLGEIALQAGEKEQAIEHFRQVRDDKKILASHNQIGKLLIADRRLTDLNDVFNASRAANDKQAINLYLLETDLLSAAGYDNASMALLNQALVDHDVYP